MNDLMHIDRDGRVMSPEDASHAFRAEIVANAIAEGMEKVMRAASAGVGNEACADARARAAEAYSVAVLKFVDDDREQS